MTRDTSPFRYLLVQALDLARAQLLLFVVVSAGLAGVIWKIFGDDVGRAFDAADMVGALLAGTLLIAILMAAGGVAGTDIKQGYYRALFSKPMAPWSPKAWAKRSLGSCSQPPHAESGPVRPSTRACSSTPL